MPGEIARARVSSEQRTGTKVYPTLDPAKMALQVDRPVVLVVLDGWGHRESTEGNAIAMARTPTWDRLWARAPRTLLHASGLAVGLPEGQMGNSEVGHLNLGAGRVVQQDLVRIGASIRDGSFRSVRAFRDACAHVRASGRADATLHLMGLVGDGGVHAHDDHLVALLELAGQERVPRIALHLLLDGRDTLPTSALGTRADINLKPVSVPVDSGAAAQISAGSIVDVWVNAKDPSSAAEKYGNPVKTLQAAPVSRVPEASGNGLSSASGKTAVQIMVPEAGVQALIAAIDQGARITLVPVPGSPHKVGA